jgi:ABC-type multidrug transport system ATPase subunit
VAPAIELEGLTRRYGDREALAGVTLSLEPGASLVVFGPNWAGKTTLLRILATLLRPHGGTARVLGRDLPRDGWAVRGRIGFLGHAPLLYRDLTARENLRFHARLHGAPETRIDELLERVGLAARADDPVHTYSRGMVQRAAVARAVLHDPEVVLLDEPTANLDPRARRRFIELIGRLPATKLVATHDLEMVLELCQRAVLLDAGHVVANGLVRNLLGDPYLLEAHGLEMPFSLRIGRQI